MGFLFKFDEGIASCFFSISDDAYLFDCPVFFEMFAEFLFGGRIIQSADEESSIGIAGDLFIGEGIPLIESVLEVFTIGSLLVDFL